MNRNRLLLLPAALLISACTNRQATPILSSVPPTPSGKILPSKAVDCVDLWVVIPVPGPDDGHHDQLIGRTLRGLAHNNGVIQQVCGK